MSPTTLSPTEVEHALTVDVRDAASSPTHEAARIASRPGVDLHGTWHVPAGPSRGVAVVAPGVAVPARVIAPLADALAAAGWTALSFDFPGIGADPTDVRDVPGGMAEWGSHDLDAVLRLGRREAGTDPLVLVGHSAGAWLACLAEASSDLDAIVAIASMSGYWRTLKADERKRMLFAFHVALPLADRVLGRVPAWLGLGENAPGGALAQWARWCRSPGFFRDDPTVRTHEQGIDAPVRVLLPTDDQWATRAACEGIWDHLPNAPVDYVEIDPMDHGGQRIGHLGLLRDRFADTVWADTISWLNETTARGQ